MCNRIKSANTVYWDLINSNMNRRDVQEGCAKGLYRVYTCSSNTDDENMNVLQLIISLVSVKKCHRERATNKHTTKEHTDGMVFIILGMWMFLTAMERSMRVLGIYPQQQTVVTAVEDEDRDVRAGGLR